MDLLNIIYVVAAVLLLFGAAIFVHEFGHYWVARRRGMKVEAFAIGFGPKIFGWTRDGIEYSIRWIPAGGFVKLPQMITSEALEGKADDAVPPATPESKILVAFAGPFMNVVFAFVIGTVIYFAGLPTPVNPALIGYVAPGSEEAALGIEPGDRILSVDGREVTTWQEVFETTALARTNVLAVVIEREGVAKEYQLSATVSETLGLKMLNLDPQDHAIIGRTTPGSSAEAAELQSGDVILSFGGVPVASPGQMQELVKKRPDLPTPIEIERDGKRLQFEVTPRMNEASGRPLIGVEFVQPPMRYEVQRPGPTPWAQVALVWDKTVRTLGALFHPRETGVGVRDLSGPVGILGILAHQVNTDYRLALSFLVLLNINLAILNLLPVPVLDGGHILMSVVEKIRRRPLSVRFVEYTTTAFALMLISFMLYVTFFDLNRVPIFKNMFQSESVIEEPDAAPRTDGEGAADQDR